MKFQFNNDLPHQRRAWEATVALFKGQESCAVPFSMPQLGSLDYGSDAGTANRLQLDEGDLLANLSEVQLHNGLKASTQCDKANLHYTIEMETGTGKTYVYLRSIYELNKAYGLTKFIIVVPSLAIKEGVNKSIQMTKDHFGQLYQNTACDAFVYDSANLEQVRNFAESSHIQIMIINIQAFSKSFTDPSKEDKANIIHRSNDRLEGQRPIELIAKTNPVVIIDEPQSVDTTAKSNEAIKSLNPLFTLRYSATHKDKHLPIYKLDAVDAYQQKLVKQIAVLPVEAQNDHNRAYIRLLKVRNSKGAIEAEIEYDAFTQSGAIKREKKWLKQGADLYERTKRDIYEGYVLQDISAEPDNQWVSFQGREDFLRVGEAIGAVDDDALKRQQIAQTIEKHFERELVLSPKGIKVLSLFFIDKVANYRAYDDAGHPTAGKYARMFEEEYLKQAKRPKFQSLFKEVDVTTHVGKVHNGYFSQDKKGVWKDTKDNTEDAGRAYELIMKEKEKLLDLNEPLRFIFSHSALREGWDNPNVFQICTLNESASTIKKRQEIGRGLRLAVDSTGNRVEDSNFTVNTLTVITNESYTDFVEKLQREIEEEEGIKFGVVEDHSFANILVPVAGKEPEYLGQSRSEAIFDYLRQQQLVDSKGKIQDALRVALKNGTLTLPTEFQAQQPAIEQVLKKLAGGLDVKDARKAQAISLKKEVLLSPEFADLWERIKYKTIYQVDFDVDRFVVACVQEMQFNMVIVKPKFSVSLAKVAIDVSGVSATVVQETTADYVAQYDSLPDVLTYLQNKTQLTRRTIARILQESGRLKDFTKNPQQFVEKTLEIIQRKKMHALVDGIKYEKIGDNAFYAQELFETEELRGYLEQNMLEVERSLYTHIVYDSDTEYQFAKDLELNPDVKLYAKLPSWFKIETPLGSYNPDWAILVEKEGAQRLYFVIETKSSLFDESLRDSEKHKILCGKAHFKALDASVVFAQSNGHEHFSELVG